MRVWRSRAVTIMALLGATVLPVLSAVWVGQQNVAPWVVVVFWLLAVLGALQGGAAVLGYDFALRFKWYDLWVGAYVDHAKRTLYVCPLPCVLLTFEPTTASDKERGRAS